MSVLIAEHSITLEQIAMTIEQMDLEEQRRLLELAPSLRQLANQIQPRTLDQAAANVARLKKRLSVKMGKLGQSANDPFLGDLTWAQYIALSDEEKERFWAQWEEIDLLSMKEREVVSHALPA